MYDKLDVIMYDVDVIMYDKLDWHSHIEKLINENDFLCYPGLKAS